MFNKYNEIKIKFKEKEISIIEGNFIENKEKIDKFLTENKITLPEEYYQFLLNYSEIEHDHLIHFKPKKINPFTSNDGYNILSFLYDVKTLIEEYNSYQNRVSNDVIAIGETPGGNLICIGVAEFNFGKIYFWNHEEELLDNEVYLISNSLINFINQIKNKKEENSLLSKDSVVSFWISEELLKDINK